MPVEPIPEELRRFILTSVPSVPFVEALLVYRGAGGTPVALETVASRLYIGEKAAAEIVEQLAAARVVARAADEPGYRFQPATPELATVIEQLGFFYRTQLVEVTNVIHSRTLRRAHQFADAFKLRKDT